MRTAHYSTASVLRFPLAVTRFSLPQNLSLHAALFVCLTRVPHACPLNWLVRAWLTQIETCEAGGKCSAVSTTQIVLDSNWMWEHDVGGSTNCYTGNTWDAQLCPDPVTCAKNCALDAADYDKTYGISVKDNALKLKFVQKAQYGVNVGSRTYLMDSPSTYYKFKLKNREFTFDTDVSTLPCGLNGALCVLPLRLHAMGCMFARQVGYNTRIRIQC